MAAVARVAVLAVATTGLAACAEEAEPLAGTGGELISLEGTATTTPTTDAATTVPPTDPPAITPPAEPVDPVTECLDWFKFKIDAEDVDVVEFWEDELDEDLVQLVAECERLVTDEPERVEDMIEENQRIDEFLREMATATTPPE